MGWRGLCQECLGWACVPTEPEQVHHHDADGKLSQGCIPAECPSRSRASKRRPNAQQSSIAVNGHLRLLPKKQKELRCVVAMMEACTEGPVSHPREYSICQLESRPTKVLLTFPKRSFEMAKRGREHCRSDWFVEERMAAGCRTSQLPKTSYCIKPTRIEIKSVPMMDPATRSRIAMIVDHGLCMRARNCSGVIFLASWSVRLLLSRS